MKLNNNEEEELSKIITNEEEVEEEEEDDDDDDDEKENDDEDEENIEITYFAYPQSQYSFTINEEISIIPSLNGDKCEFSIRPSLPYGIILDRKNGIIHGKVNNPIKNTEYEVICKNVKSEKKFKISLEFSEITFTKLYKNKYISISSNGKLITNNQSGYNNCYLNLKMEKGIYHIKYKFHQNGSSFDDVFLGLSIDNTYSGDSLCNKSMTCNYVAYSGKSDDITPYSKIGTVVTKNPKFKHTDGSIYEVIVDMNKRKFWISHNNSSPILLVKDLSTPLYPYAIPFNQNTSFELLSAYKQY